MGLLPTHWYYNTETGQLTQGNNLENLGNNLVGGAGWHELNISGSASASQAAAAAQAEFPSGAAPTTAGITPARVAGTAASEAAQAVTGSPSSCCLLNVPYLNACLFTRTEARALIGGLLVGAAGILTIVGLSLLVVEGFQRTGAGNAAGRSLETVGAGLAFIPGAEAAGIAVGGAGAAARRAGSSSGARRSLDRRSSEQAARRGVQQREAQAAQQRELAEPS